MTPDSVRRFLASRRRRPCRRLLEQGVRGGEQVETAVVVVVELP